jgi:hypothetical protein
MGPEIIAVMIPIVAIIGGLTMIIFLRYYENVERMAMIEKGLNPFQHKPKQRLNPSVTLRFALLSIGAGFGFLFGSILSTMSSSLPEEVAYFSMILIFGGLGLLASYIVELRMAKKEAEEDRRKIAYEANV